MDWLEGLVWAGVIAAGACFIWDLFLPLDLLIIGVVYISRLIGWLFLTRKKTISGYNAWIFRLFLQVLLRQCQVLHREFRDTIDSYGKSEMYR